MAAKLRSGWKKTKGLLLVLGRIALLVVIILLIFVEVRLYGTGFAGKTLWEWLQLAIVPVVLTFGVWWLTRLQQRRDQRLADQQAEREREISLDNQYEAALQKYIDSMSGILLGHDLSKSDVLDKVRKIGRVQTLTVLPRCDGRRKAIVLRFLCESDLINKDNKVIDLDGADFCGADLSRTQLSKADLSRADLIEANLIEANLCSSILVAANLSNAKLSRADLRGVDLSEANLGGAIGISNEELVKNAKSLKGATMPDGSTHS